MAKYALRLTVLAYLALLLIVPVGLIAWRTFDDGPGAFIDALTTHSALHA
ncbi:sulfate ABC transporter, partial [Micromonospora aurantiaca]|nr:sulfate ABC transporter [Micromonospora aurantiaca]